MKKQSVRRPMTKSPVRLAREALKVARKALPRYSNRFSRRDFTQAQLFAILALRQFFKTDYRGIVQMLEDFSDLRKALGLKKVPHYSVAISPFAARRRVARTRRPFALSVW